MTEADKGQTALTEVTAEQFVAIRADLEKLLKAKQKPGETLADYATRLAKTANDPKKVSDDDWETLDEQTQMWVNGAVAADEKGSAPPLPSGAEGAAGAADEAEGDDATAGEDAGDEPKEGKEEENVKPKKPSAKTAPAKKALAAKKPVSARAAKAGKEAPGRPGRKPKHDEACLIKLSVAENPHRRGAKDFDKFKKLKTYDGKPIGKALAGGVELAYLRYAEKRGIVAIKKPAKQAA